MNLFPSGQNYYSPGGGGGNTPPAPTLEQHGSISLLSGTSRYQITFPTPFAAAPTYFDAAVQMPDSNGEALEAVADKSTLNTTGVVIWLTGTPTAASTGGIINWLAKK